MVDDEKELCTECAKFLEESRTMVGRYRVVV
jgi:hypothetical protein